MDATLVSGASLLCGSNRVEVAMDRTGDARGSGRSAARDGVLVAALASGETQAEAARMAGMSERTVRRRLSQAAFADRVAAERRDVATRTAARITALASSDAVAVLHELMVNGEVPPSVRLRAALGALSVAPAWRDQGELEATVSALEARLPEEWRLPS